MLIEGEYGDKSLVINTRYDLSGQTGLNLVVLRPDGTGFSRNEVDVSVGLVDTTDDDGNTVLANEYVKYTLKNGDISLPGRYRLQLTVNGNSGQLVSLEKYVDVKKKISVPV